MKICIMKREALDTLKSSLKTIYAKYYTQKTNAWIYDVCGGDPFQEFIEIPDFDLAPLDKGLTPGEIDLLNCKIVYEKLSFLTESQAADERLWAGLTHGVFYDYMRKRFGYDEGKIPNAKVATRIQTQFFYTQGIRAGFFRNRIAKSWWVGRCTYDKSRENPFEKLDALGSADIVTKISEIFKSNNFSSNPTILNGIVKCFEYFNEEQIKIIPKDHLRPSLQLLNAIGGNIILDALDEDEIADILIQNILSLRSGDKAKLSFKNVQDDDDDIDQPDDLYTVEASVTKTKKNVVYEEVLEENDDSEISAQEEGQSENVEDEDIWVDDDPIIGLGSKFSIVHAETGDVKSFNADYLNGVLPPFIAELLGRRIGDIVTFKGEKYKVSEIKY